MSKHLTPVKHRKPGIFAQLNVLSTATVIAIIASTLQISTAYSEPCSDLFNGKKSTQSDVIAGQNDLTPVQRPLPEALALFAAERENVTLHIQDFSRTTAIDFMRAIRKNMEEDARRRLPVKDYETTIKHAETILDGKVLEKVFAALLKINPPWDFSKDVKGNTKKAKVVLKNLVEFLQAKGPMNPTELTRAIGNFDKDFKGVPSYQIAQLLLHTSGFGSVLVLDGNYVIIHQDYRPEITATTQAERDAQIDFAARRGRSGIQSPGRGFLDASDPYLLSQFKALFGKGDAAQRDITAKAFGRVLADFVVRNDVSGFKNLNELGKEVASDFIGVWQAEAVRYLLSNVNEKGEPALEWVPGKSDKHDWHISLHSALEMWEVLGEPTGKVMKDGQWVKASEKGPGDYYSMNMETKRSGIGRSDKDRAKLQRFITRAARELDFKSIAPLEKALGRHLTIITPARKDGQKDRVETGLDLFQSFYIRTDSRDPSVIAELQQNGQELVDAYVAFKNEVRDNWEAVDQIITKIVSKRVENRSGGRRDADGRRQPRTPRI